MAWTEESGLRAQLYAKELFKRAINKSTWFSRYAGEGINKVVQVKTDLTKSAGSTINFGLLPRVEARTSKLDAAWADSTSTITADNDLETNEEDLNFYADSLTVQQYRHAVKSPGMYYEQKVSFDVRNDMMEALAIWLKEELDWRITKTLGHTEPTYRLYPGTRSDTASITSGDTITLTDISKLKRYAQYKRMRPVIVDGNEYYLFLMHPEVMNDLRNEYSSSVPSWWNAMLQAQERGDGNPIFAGAAGIYDGVILAENRDIWKLTNASACAFTWNLFLGAQAGLWGWAKKPFWVEKLFDYKNRLGVATGYIGGAARAAFTGAGATYDHAVVGYGCTMTEVESGANW